MGMSADADLAFGIWIPGSDDYEPGNPAYEWMQQWHEDHEDDDEEFTLESYLAKRAGLENPYDAYPQVDQMAYHVYPTWLEGEGQWFDKLVQEWSATKERLIEAAPVELIDFGYDGYTSCILAIKGTHAHAYGYQREAVDLPALVSVVTPAKISEAIRYCSENELPPFENPQWWLLPSYG